MENSLHVYGELNSEFTTHLSLFESPKRYVHVPESVNVTLFGDV